jgi:hypothetical protein
VTVSDESWLLLLSFFALVSVVAFIVSVRS